MQASCLLPIRLNKIVTNRFLALPIFADVVCRVLPVCFDGGYLGYGLAKDGLFGEGWFLFGNGRAAYEEAAEEYAVPAAMIEAFESAAEEAGVDPAEATTLTATGRDV